LPTKSSHEICLRPGDFGKPADFREQGLNPPADDMLDDIAKVAARTLTRADQVQVIRVHGSGIEL